MIILETCPVCGHEMIEDVILSFPRTRFRHCEKCDLVIEDEPDFTEELCDE